MAVGLLLELGGLMPNPVSRLVCLHRLAGATISPVDKKSFELVPCESVETGLFPSNPHCLQLINNQLKSDTSGHQCENEICY